MYKNILVPIDGSNLSATLVGRAVELAKKLDSKVTFLHVAEDYSATQEGAVQIVVAPDLFHDLALGDTWAILSKASIAAEVLDVNHDVISVVSNRPYEAILSVAKDHLCDLIFIASHGVRGIAGMMRTSQTEMVIKHSSISVLVSLIETNDTELSMNRAIGIIRDEHRSIAVVIKALHQMVRTAVSDSGDFNIEFIRFAITYMHRFPAALHHPKEEHYLFSKLRLKRVGIDSLLDELESQHKQEAVLIQDLNAALNAVELGGDDCRSNVYSATCALADAIWKHMGLEEKEVIPAACRCLSREDWDEIATAFSNNRDTFLSNVMLKEMGGVFTKIVNLLHAEYQG